MGKPLNKPWERKWIPASGPRVQDPAWTAPATPEGWHREARRDYVEFTYGKNPFTYDHWQIIGRAGCKWRVYRTENRVEVYDEIQYGRALKFEAASLDACLVFVKIEQANEPETKVGMDWADTKTARLAAGYNMGAARMSGYVRDLKAGNDQLDVYRVFVDKQLTTVVIDELSQMDFSALEERVIKNAKP